MKIQYTKWCCDSSGAGWGICTLEGEFIAQGIWSENMSENKSTGLELQAAKLAIHFSNMFSVKNLILYTDSDFVIKSQKVLQKQFKQENLKIEWMAGKILPADRWY